MFNLFSRKKYNLITLPLVSGEAHGIAVSFKDYPVRESDNDLKERIEAFPDFNAFLIKEIWNQIGNYDEFSAGLSSLPVTINLQVKSFTTVLEIRMSQIKSKRNFKAQLPDAIINALEKEKIGR